MKSDFKRIYTGSLVNAQHIEGKLKEFNITPVIKDESESGRLAGFAPPVFGQVRVFVHKDEFEKATAL
jgi:hypothetical protein